jgi:hypothetical protein
VHSDPASSTSDRGETHTNPRRASHLVDGYRPRRRIGDLRLEALHVQAEADRWERDTEQEALEAAVGHRILPR